MASGLLGTYHHRIDPKGRVAVPATLRRCLPEGTVVAPGLDRRLMIWPPDEWKEQEQRFRRTAETPAQERRFIRRLFGNAYPFELDVQGRLLLSAWQREWAQIGETVVFVGVGNGVEVASEENWTEQEGPLDRDAFERLADLVSQRGGAAPTARP